MRETRPTKPPTGSSKFLEWFIVTVQDQIVMDDRVEWGLPCNMSKKTRGSDCKGGKSQFVTSFSRKAKYPNLQLITNMLKE